MTDGKLAIIMPTHRFDATARHNINVLSQMSCEEIHIYVGDNSCDRDKWSFLEGLSDRNPHFHAFMHSQNLGAERNWLFLLQQQRHEFICMASDDDIFTPDYFVAGYEALKKNSTLAAASGLFIFLTQENERFIARRVVSNDAETACERIATCDSIPYAVFRRSNLGRFPEYIHNRPFSPAYMDQIHTYNLLSQGTYVTDPSRKMFVYDNHNWSTELEFDTSARFYADAGLSKEFQYLHHLSWAVDAAHFFLSTYRPLEISDNEALDIANVIFLKRISSFRSQYTADINIIEQIFDQRGNLIQNIRKILESSLANPVSVFDCFVEILRDFNPAISSRYDLFIKQSLHPNFRFITADLQDRVA